VQTSLLSVKSVGAVSHPVWEQQECSGCLLVIQGRCGCMLHYFEHELIVIHRVADGNTGELYVENISILEPKTLPWVGCPDLLKICEAILSFVTRARLQKAVM